jgi:hypothetical protein
MISIRIIFLILSIWGSLLQAETVSHYDYLLDEKEMPVCLSMKNEPSRGIVIFWDKLSMVRPRGIQYLWMNELTYNDSKMNHQSSIQKCSDLKYINTQKLIGKNIDFNQPPEEFYIENFKMNAFILERLYQVQNGQNKFYNNDENATQGFLDGLFTSFKKETNKVLTSDYGSELATKLYHRYIESKKFPEDCKELIGKCDYYLCRESKKACNSQGYFIGFGYQYCSESIEHLVKKVSPLGQKWLTTTATCLQKKMENFSNKLSCQEMKDEAIRSHDECYSEISFCSLKLKDMTYILKMIYPTLTDLAILKEGVEVLKHCGGKQ